MRLGTEGSDPGLRRMLFQEIPKTVKHPWGAQWVMA